MISLEQVRALEARVEKAVSLIASLRSENASMRAGLSAAEKRVMELEALVGEFQKDQARIEEGILDALRKLDAFEDAAGAQPIRADKPPAEDSKAAERSAEADAAPAVAESAGHEDAPAGGDDSTDAEASGDLDIF